MIGKPIDCTPTVEGKPWKPGVYVCEIYFGWKLLEWDGAHWHFGGRTALWQAGDPFQWVGPLPERLHSDAKPKLDFDL